MKFRFPIVIIDEDYRSENTSGLGIRALAQAIEAEGFEVLGVTSYGDLSQFAQQQSRASAFILSIDDEEFTRWAMAELDPVIHSLRSFIGEVRRKNADVPIYIYGETKTSRHLPNDILRELHGFIHMFEDTPEFVAAHHPRGQELPGGRAAAVLQGAAGLRRRWLLQLALPRSLGRRGLPEKPDRPDVPPVLRREHAARRRVQRGGRAGPAAGPQRRRSASQRAQCGTHLQCRPLLLRDQRHVHVEQDGVAPHRGARRRGGGGPQLPQVHPALHHHDGCDSGVHEAHAQPLRHHRPDPAKRVLGGAIQAKIAANPLLKGVDAKRSSRAC